MVPVDATKPLPLLLCFVHIPLSAAWRTGKQAVLLTSYSLGGIAAKQNMNRNRKVSNVFFQILLHFIGFPCVYKHIAGKILLYISAAKIYTPESSPLHLINHLTNISL